MFDYGRPPEADEIELSIFGPGYGEAIAIHRGAGGWILIDSCLSPSSRGPASLEYLERIGIDLALVHTIVASHWHDDHVKGLSRIVEKCPNAEFHMSSVFNDDEALSMLSAYGGSAAAPHSAGAKELFHCMRISSDSYMAHHRSIVWEEKVLGRAMKAVAFSPTAEASKQTVSRMAQLLPSASAPIRHIPELKPNLEAVVISLDIGDESILLGSDLEDHDDLGWGAIIQSNYCLRFPKAGLFKVAHHGSISGDHDEIWSSLLTPNPTSVMTPFSKGVSLPTNADRVRIAQRSKGAYISSDGSKRPQIDTGLVRRMDRLATEIKPINTAFGVVRARKKLGSPEWTIELFGAAKQLQKAA